MLRKHLSKFFCKRFYPARHRDWYKNKGYVGDNDQEIFGNFLSKQRLEDGIFYDCFIDLQISRFKVQSGIEFLDCVEFVPDNQHIFGQMPCSFIISEQNISTSGQGVGKVFVLFQGRAEYYESRFRDMALLCKATGAKVIGFNPRGMHSSTGHIKILADLVDDGVALIHYLMNKGIKAGDVIMLGNSLGGAVQEMVCQKLSHEGVFGFRQINSNSFRSLAAVVAVNLKVSFLEKWVAKLLHYSGWEIDVPSSFYEVGLNRIYLRRYQDRTILPGAEYHDQVDINKCIDKIPYEYKDKLSWILRHNQLYYSGAGLKDPHVMSLYHFKVKKIDEDDKSEDWREMSVFELINMYLEII